MYLIGTLSVARTFSLMYPFKKTFKRKWVFVLLAAYLALVLLYEIFLTGLWGKSIRLSLNYFYVLDHVFFEQGRKSWMCRIWESFIPHDLWNFWDLTSIHGRWKVEKILKINILGISLRKAVYTEADAYCYMTNDEDHRFHAAINVLDNTLYCIQIAFPILVVFLSCLISISIIARSKNHVQSAGTDSTSDAVKKKATITIILLTSLHIVFSIPMLTNFLLWTITAHQYTWPGPFYSSTVMLYYSWNVSDVLCLALNSMINPIILLTRIQAFKDWIKENTRKTLICTSCGHKSNQVSALAEDQQPHVKTNCGEDEGLGGLTKRVSHHIIFNANTLAGKDVSDSRDKSTI